MSEITLSVPNISCHHCAHTIKSEVSELKGIQSVEVDVNSKKVTVRFELPATESAIRNLMQEINYPAEA